MFLGQKVLLSCLLIPLILKCICTCICVPENWASRLLSSSLNFNVFDNLIHMNPVFTTNFQVHRPEIHFLETFI